MREDVVENFTTVFYDTVVKALIEAESKNEEICTFVFLEENQRVTKNELMFTLNTIECPLIVSAIYLDRKKIHKSDLEDVAGVIFISSSEESTLKIVKDFKKLIDKIFTGDISSLDEYYKININLITNILNQCHMSLNFPYSIGKESTTRQ